MVFRGANIKRFIINLKEKHINMLQNSVDTFEQWNEIRIKIENTLSTFLSMDATQKCLKNLKYFICDLLIGKSKILPALVNTCTNLQGIKIQDNAYLVIKDSLIPLIRYQKNLEHLHIQGSPYNQDHGSNITQLVSSLENNASSYKKIMLEDGYVDSDDAFKFLMDCKNLEVLQIK